MKFKKVGNDFIRGIRGDALFGVLLFPAIAAFVLYEFLVAKPIAELITDKLGW